MSARSASRAASGAQRSGAAALHSTYLRDANDDCATRALYYRFSFFALAPARCLRRLIGGDQSLVDNGPGGAVLWFYRGKRRRTSKLLLLPGSVVLFCGLTRDVRAGAGACVCRDHHQNYRTTELTLENGRNLPFLEGEAVLARFCGSGPNKIGGGYAFAGVQVASRADQQLIGGAGREKFWGWARVGGGDRAGGDLGALEGGNGGFLPFVRGRLGHVGMALLEWCGQGHGIGSFSGAGRKPARFTSTPPSIAQAEGGTPPSAARPMPSMLADMLIGISIDLQNRRSAPAKGVEPGLGGEAGPRFGRRMGSGVRALVQRRSGRRGNAAQTGDQMGVRDRKGSLAVRRFHRERTTLWGGLADVNA